MFLCYECAQPGCNRFLICSSPSPHCRIDWGKHLMKSFLLCDGVNTIKQQNFQAMQKILEKHLSQNVALPNTGYILGNLAQILRVQQHNSKSAQLQGGKYSRNSRIKCKSYSKITPKMKRTIELGYLEHAGGSHLASLGKKCV